MSKQNDLLMDSSILYRSTQKYYDKMLQNLKLTYAQLPILIHIYENEGASLQDIARAGGYDKGTVTKNVQKLHSLGYVNILSNLKDKRAKEIYTTSLAKKHISEIYGIRRDWWHHITQDLDSEQIQVFSDFYQTLSNHARTYADLEQTDLQFYKFKPLSLTDFDGYLSCSLYTGGCNFKCPHCTDPSLVYLKEDMHPVLTDEIKAYLQKQRNKIEGVYISGGEPLMHENIIHFLRYLKSLNYKVKIHTNGMYYDTLKNIINLHLVDYVSIDIKNCLSKYGKSCGVDDIDVTNIQNSISFLKQNLVDYEILIRVNRDDFDLDSFKELGICLKGIKKVLLVPFSYGNTDFSMDPTKEEMNKYYVVLKETIHDVEVRGIEDD